MRKVLILGAGHVCGPLIEYLNKDPNIHLTLGEIFKYSIIYSSLE